MRDMFERISLVCVLASAPLLAAAQAPSTDNPATTSDSVQTEQEVPADADGETAPSAEEAEAVPEEAEAMPEPVEGQIVLQSEDSILAEDLIGLTVFSNAEESVGDINNIIINLDGTVEGVVVGVGGFLGIGEKEVAIQLDNIDLVTRDGGGAQLILNATREELEAAPPFKTAREQRREAEAEEMKQNIDSGVAPAVPSDN